MSYNQHGHSQPERGEPRDGPAWQGQGDGANIVGRIISGVTGAIALIFVVHIVFSLTDANDANSIVYFVYQMAKTLVLGFGDVFTPNDAAIGLVLNYGLAALVYLVIGQLIARALKRH